MEIEEPVPEKPTRGRRGKKEVVETVEAVETVSRGRRKAAPASLKEPSLASKMRRDKSAHAQPEEEQPVAEVVETESEVVEVNVLVLQIFEDLLMFLF